MMPERSISSVALIGATGNLGSYILHALLEASYKVTMVVRPESEFALTPLITNGFQPALLSVARVSLDDDTALAQALTGQDAVVVCVSKGDISVQNRLIDAAVKAGVKRFIPSEFGGDTLSEGLMADVPVLRGKQTVLDHLKRAAEKNSSFTWTGISCGAFLDWGLESGFFGFTIPQQTAVIYSSGTKRFNATTRQTIGQAVALTLQNQETENRYIYIADVTTTQNEILGQLQIQTGVRWRITTKDARMHREEGVALLQEGNFPAATPKLLLGNLYGNGQGTLFDVASLENKNLGLKTRRLDEVVAEALGKGTNAFV